MYGIYFGGGNGKFIIGIKFGSFGFFDIKIVDGESFGGDFEFWFLKV